VRILSRTVSRQLPVDWGRRAVKLSPGLLAFSRQKPSSGSWNVLDAKVGEFCPGVGNGADFVRRAHRQDFIISRGISQVATPVGPKTRSGVSVSQ